MVMTPSRTRLILVSVMSFSGLSLIPKLLSIVKDMAVASRFGVSEILDLYLMAFVLIGMPVSIIAIAIQTTLIPALVSRDVTAAAGLLGGAIKLVMCLLVLALPIWLGILPMAVDMLYPASNEGIGQGLLTACLWLIPYYFINGINLLLYGALQARKIFWTNAALPGLFPLAILVFVWVIPGSDIRSLLIGTVVGSLLEGLFLYYVLQRKQLVRILKTTGAGLTPVLRLAMPLMAGGLVASSAPVIEQFIAFRLGPGMVSLLNYGNKVPAAVNSLLLTAVGIVVLPHFAELMAKREWCSCKELHLRLSGIALGIGILAAIIGIGFAETMIRLLFERGAFTATDTYESAAIMRIYLLQLPFLLVAMVSIRALVAMGRPYVVTAITASQLLIASSLAFIFSTWFGVAGVAAGTVAGTLFGAAIFVTAAWYRFNEHSRKQMQ